MKFFSTLLLILSLSVMAGSQNWRVVTATETHTPSKGPPRTFTPGIAVCRPGRIVATYDPVRRVFTGQGCPPLVVFSGGFEHE